MQNRLVFSSMTLEDDKLFGGVSYTQIVNSDTNYTVGNVACASITFTSEVINMSYINQYCTYYVKQHSDNAYRLVGAFKVLDVTKSKNRYTVTAYDYICKFDNYAYDYVASLTFPVTVGTLFGGLCTYFGCTAQSTVFTNSTFSIETNNFESTVTGREILNYIAETAGGFIRCRTDGKIEVAYFTENTSLTQLATPQNLTVSGDAFSFDSVTNASGYCIETAVDGLVKEFYVDSTGNWVSSLDVGIGNDKYTYFEYQDYNTPTINYVHIGTSPTDEGISTGGTLDNALEIINNPILKISSTNESAVKDVCDNIYNIVHEVSYQPSEMGTLADYSINAGDIIRVDGHPVYVMEKSWTASGATFKCNGSSTRESGQLPTQAEKSQADVSEIQTEIDDLWDTTDDLQTDIDGLQTDVEEIQDDYLVSASVSGDVLTITNNHGVSITFTGGGYFG